MWAAMSTATGILTCPVVNSVPTMALLRFKQGDARWCHDWMRNGRRGCRHRRSSTMVAIQSCHESSLKAAAGRVGLPSLVKKRSHGDLAVDETC